MTKIHLLLLLAATAAVVANSITAAAQSEPPPDSIAGATPVVYKTAGHTQLRLHVFEPVQTRSKRGRPAVVFFFGGGWSQGTVMQFVPHAHHLADLGFVAVVADYRVKSRHGVTPFDCIDDARSAMQWLHTHAARYNIDRRRIAAAGGSAGGHLAAATALVPGTDRAFAKYAPALLVLFNPVVDMPAFFRERSHDSWPASIETISPIHHVRKGLPPTLIFHGSGDTIVPIDQVVRFCELMESAGNTCDLVTFDGRGHGFFNANRAKGADYRATLERMETFFSQMNWLPASRTEKQ